MASIPPNTNYDGLLKSIRQGIDGVYQKGIKQGRYLEQQQRLMEKAKSGWISVKERLPEDDVDVIIFAVRKSGDGVIAMTSYTHNMHGYSIEGWRTPWQYFFYDHTITHWMHLPEPPKAKKEDK